MRSVKYGCAMLISFVEYLTESYGLKKKEEKKEICRLNNWEIE